MAAPLLVVIQGAPGSGKTTLADRLRQDIDLPILGKDDLKELLFETIPQSDRDFSRLQGGIAFDMLYAFAKRFLLEGYSVVIEGAFWTEVSQKEILAILRETNAMMLELFCHVDEDIRQSRFDQRARNGSRHPAHMDTDKAMMQPIATRSYERIGIGDVIEIDTTEPISDHKYGKILEAIRSKLPS